MSFFNKEELKNQLVRLREDGFYGENGYSDYLYQVISVLEYRDRFGDGMVIKLKHHSLLPGRRGSQMRDRDFNCGETITVRIHDLLPKKYTHVTETTVNKFMRKC